MGIAAKDGPQIDQSYCVIPLEVALGHNHIIINYIVLITFWIIHQGYKWGQVLRRWTQGIQIVQYTGEYVPQV